MWKRNTEGLKTAAKKRTLEKEARADKAIKTKAKRGEPINFQSVAEEAGVTAAFLYRHKTLRLQIENLRNQKPKKQFSSKLQASDTSKDTVIAMLREEIKKLRSKNKELEDENSVALGLAEDAKRTHSVGKVERYLDEIEQLKTMIDISVKKLQIQIEYNQELTAKNEEQLAELLSLQKQNEWLENQIKLLMEQLERANHEQRQQDRKRFIKAKKREDRLSEFSIPDLEF